MQVLRLANENQTEVIDLLDGVFGLNDPGFDMETPGIGGTFTYEPYGAQFDFENLQPHTETFSLSMTGETSVVLAELDRLQDFIEAIRRYSNDDMSIYPRWLEWSADGEEPKRSLIYSMAWQVTSRDNLTPGQLCTILGTLSLTRHPLWENVAISKYKGARYYGYVNTANIDAAGGKFDFTNIPGNTLGRMSLAALSSTNLIANYLSRMWVGIRRNNYSVANFEPLWECEDGTIDPEAIGDTAVQADVAPLWGVNDASPGGALGNDSLRTTFAVDATLRQRANITVAQVCAANGHANYNHQWGRYLVLLRCRLTGAGTIRVQMRWGYTGNIIEEDQYVSNTNWELVPLGNISIPAWAGSEFIEDIWFESFRIDLYAEQLTAGVSFDWDCLVLIPNEHMVYVDGANCFQAGGGERNFVLIRTHEDDTDDAAGYDELNDRIEDSVEVAPNEWYLPPPNGTIIVAGQRPGGQFLIDDMRAELYYLPRWLLYRGV